MNDDIVPIHTTRLEDINTYRKALLSFYETSDYSEYADYFLDIKIMLKINLLQLSASVAHSACRATTRATTSADTPISFVENNRHIHCNHSFHKKKQSLTVRIDNPLSEFV